MQITSKAKYMMATSITSSHQRIKALYYAYGKSSTVGVASMDYILTCNAGSSSIKLALCREDSLEEILHIAVENITQAQTVLVAPDGIHPIEAPSHSNAIDVLYAWLQRTVSDLRIVAVGHRIVHGGGVFCEPTIIDQEVTTKLEQISTLDPEHMPAALQVLTQLQRALPSSLHVACFDTAFFHDVPTNAKLIAIPREYYEKGVRRYGFHGLSYQYLLHNFAEHEGLIAAEGKVIIAHLGSGCSLAAFSGGKPIDMTMGFTPTSGIIMSTRSGDLDPGVATYLAEHAHMNTATFSAMANHQSGLLGISGLSADMHTLLDAQTSNQAAAEAVDLFCYTASKAVGALATTTSGLHSLIFSGGIGERSPEIRRRICERLEFLGVSVDDARNQRNERLISRDDTDVGVHIIHTNEASSIAILTKQVIVKGDN